MVDEKEFDDDEEEEMKNYFQIKPEIRVHEAYDAISQEIRRHTLHPHIIMSKKQKRAKIKLKKLKKKIAGSVLWKEPRSLRHDHWIEFLILGKSITRRILVDACDWKHELGKEKLNLNQIYKAVKLALEKAPVPITTE
jgi:hypothetical protein